MKTRSLVLAGVSSALALFTPSTPAAAAVPVPAKINYNRDIRPILSDTCFKCHGPDAKQVKGGLRLDLPESATQAAKSGKIAIVPKQAAKSELVRRITTKDADDLMPPPNSGKHLAPQQVDLLKRWVEQGAEYQTHWAYKPLTRPAVAGKVATPGAVDAFITERLAAQKLKPQPEADRVTLIRRLSFDLTGLPPKPADAEAFVADKSPKAYEQLVDRLLASPHYGERLAMYWLDLVRYADTRGYHGDQHQSVMPYRDYVINAFNQNKRFDVFTAEQLAGDLLPAAGQEQRVASGYNKLLMTTEEGGAQAKEYTAKYAADRVRNASVVWLGSTLGCSECHDHKYDPFTQRDFYSFAAFFADVKETAVGKLDTVPLPTPAQQKRVGEIEAGLAAVEQQIKAALAKVKYAEPEPLDAPDIDKPAGEKKPEPAAKSAPKADTSLTSQRAWEAKVRPDKKSTVPKPVLDAVNIAEDKRTAAQKQSVTDYYVEHVWSGGRATFAPLHKQAADLKAAQVELDKGVVRTMVAMATEPRMMRVLPRGNWLSDAGDVVQPAIPAFLGKVGVPDKRATRLDLAKWITAPENPLAARVFVNRVWKLLFGRGIVNTPEDFGAQGANPTHPELLDSLAADFIARGWDIKHLVKVIATSDAYKRSSRDTPELRLKDPYNAQLARQGRFRLDAEMVRDNALAVSGLLVEKVGGTSAKPYQPAGYWSYLNFPKREWENDKNDGLYRRGVYTYWCRTFLHPSLSAFDASTREECVAERVRSNTPQQALVLLNDPTYVEAARAFAERIVRDGGKDTAGRLNFAYQQALARKPRPDEAQLLADLLSQHATQYAADTKAADELLKVGAAPAASALDKSELAAWTSVARVVLNLHETITRN